MIINLLFAINRGAAQVAPYLLVVLLGLVMAQLTWQTVLYDEARSGQHPLVIKPVVSERKTPILSSVPVTLESIKRFNPWEVPYPVVATVKPPPIKQKPPPKPKEVAVVSQLNLQLIGTMVRPDGISRAILVAKNKRGAKQQYMKVGERVDGATLERIERNTVFFRNGNRLETLSMATEQDMGLGRFSPLGKSSSKNRNKRLGETDRTLSKEAYLATLDRGIGLIQGIETAPYTEGSQTVGYQLKFQGERPDIKAFGLTSGDVIRKLNGVPVTDLSQLKKLSEGLRSLSEIQIDILRENQPETLVIHIANN